MQCGIAPFHVSMVLFGGGAERAAVRARTRDEGLVKGLEIVLLQGPGGEQQMGRS